MKVRYCVVVGRELPHREERVDDDEREDRRHDHRDDARVGRPEEEVALEELRDRPHRVLAQQDRGDEEHVAPHEEAQREAGEALREVHAGGPAALAGPVGKTDAGDDVRCGIHAFLHTAPGNRGVSAHTLCRRNRPAPVDRGQTGAPPVRCGREPGPGTLESLSAPRLPPLIDVIIPAYRGLAQTRRCLESVLSAPVARAARGRRDRRREPRAGALGLAPGPGRRTGASPSHPRANAGFVASVNEGMRLHAGPGRGAPQQRHRGGRRLAGPPRGVRRPGAAGRHGHALLQQRDDRELPALRAAQRPARGATTAGLDAVFARANAGRSVDLPTAVGFCMYIARRLPGGDRALRRGGLRARLRRGGRLLPARGEGGMAPPARRRHLRLPRGRGLLRPRRASHPREGAAPHRRPPSRSSSRGWPTSSPASRCGRCAGPSTSSACAAIPGRACSSSPTAGAAASTSTCATWRGRWRRTRRCCCCALPGTAARASPGCARARNSRRTSPAGPTGNSSSRSWTRSRSRACTSTTRTACREAVLDLPGRLGVGHDVTLHDYLAVCPQHHLADADGRYCGEPDEAGCEAVPRPAPAGVAAGHPRAGASASARSSPGRGASSPLRSTSPRATSATSRGSPPCSGRTRKARRGPRSRRFASSSPGGSRRSRASPWWRPASAMPSRATCRCTSACSGISSARSRSGRTPPSRSPAATPTGRSTGSSPWNAATSCSFPRRCPRAFPTR